MAGPGAQTGPVIEPRAIGGSPSSPVSSPVVLATSNGTGMGHLAQLAVARALAKNADPLVFSMSTAVPVIASHGLRGGTAQVVTVGGCR